jgi:hypothetical protein
MIKMFIKSFKDFLDKKILLLSFVPVFISIIFLGIVFFIFSDNINQFFIWIVGHIPFINGNFISSIVQGILGIIIFYELVLIMSVLFVGFIADGVVDRINEKHYHLKKLGFGTFLGSMAEAVKSNILFIILFIILIPTMFIPFLNVVIQIFLWSFLIKSPMFYDALAFYATKDQFEKIKKSNRFKIWFLSFMAASLFLIPVFGIFSYVLQLILFTHFNLSRLQKMQNTNK